MSARRAGWIVATLVAIPGGVSLARADEAAPGVASSVDCGTMALYTLLRGEDRPADLTALNRLLPAEAHVDGYSLRELRDAGRTLGLATTGVQLRAGDFPLDRPVQAHLARGDRGHYVVVRPVGHTGSLVQVIDPGRGPLVMEATDLLASPEWTGRALVPDRRTGIVPLATWAVVLAPLAAWGCIARFRRARPRG